MPERFSMVKRGYDPLEVDDYIRQLENVIKSYKDKDSSIKNAILHAQIAGDNIVNEAKDYAKSLVGDTVKHLREVRVSISEQRRLLDNFISDYNYLANKYLTRVNESDFASLKEKLSGLEEYYDKMNERNNAIVSRTDETRDREHAPADEE